MLSWQQRIDAARELVGTKKRPRGFTREDKALAWDWMTCSCGQLDQRIPRIFVRPKGSRRDDVGLGMPQDDELRILGLKFEHAVRNNHIDRAEVIYRKVQARAEQIIEQLETETDAKIPIESVS